MNVVAKLIEQDKKIQSVSSSKQCPLHTIISTLKLGQSHLETRTAIKILSPTMPKQNYASNKNNGYLML